MPDRGHFQRLRSVVTGLSAQGRQVHVFTHLRLAEEVRQSGGTFVDLFAGRAVEVADDESWPPVCRYVAFAGTFVEQIRDEVARLRPSVILHDTFAVIGSVVARVLGIPYVNVCAGHDVVPSRFLEILREHPRVHVSNQCRRAVDRLQQAFGLTDISPFSYVSGLSPHLNLYCEPPRFLPDDDRHVFEPVAFYGSLAADLSSDSTPAEQEWAARRWFGADAERKLKIYVSFGTAIWMSRTTEALSTLQAVAAWAARQRGVRVVISLGGAEIANGQRQELERSNVAVARYIDQWSVLASADLFLTHHGLNSTHEAIAHEVPMVSYPFVWDQPGLAATCQRLGLAVGLVGDVMAAVQPRDLDAALTVVLQNRPMMNQALGDAHEWERTVIADRPRVLQRIVDLGL